VKSKQLLTKLLPVFLTLSLLSACAHEKPRPETITICDDQGCNERPKNYTSFKPEDMNSPEEIKIKALEKIAATDSRAAYDLALRFFRGDGVRQDSYKSIKWMREAAERGDFEAQKALGRVYLTGLGEMGADYGEAQKWLNMTAGQGDKEALELLKIANEARKSELDDFQWRKHWQQMFYNNWYSGYSYRWHWRNSGWHYNY
jgi:TPR repeat protein